MLDRAASSSDMTVMAHDTWGISVKRTHQADLRRAAINLEQMLRTLNFAEGTYNLALGLVTASHPVDIDGRRDTSYLVYKFENDTPAFFLHDKVQSAGAYALVMAAHGVTPAKARKWTFGLREAADEGQDKKIHIPGWMKMFRVLWFLLQPLLIFLFLTSHLREALPIQRFSERLGRNTKRPSGHHTIWLHAASLGEVKQLRPIISELSRCAGVKVLVTTFTKSSAAWLAAEFPHITHRYAVMDGKHAVRRFLDYWQPKVLIVSENEIWPEMIIQSANRGTLLLKIGIRPSRTLSRFPKITKFLLRLFTKLTCTRTGLKDELVGIGVERNRIVICADQRDHRVMLPIDETVLRDISHEIEGRRLWLAASTHETDHEIILTAHAKLAASSNRLLILAPRHPRAAGSIKKTCRQKGLIVSQRSMGESISSATQVYVADTLGELGLFFTLSSIVYLGGGMGPEGGHNPYEPASFCCEILSGPYVDNYRDAFEAVAAKTKVTFVETATQVAAEVVAHEASQLARPERQAISHASNPFQPEVADVVMAAIEWYQPMLIKGSGASS